jgi:flagellin-like hook-associated protein FlgL
MVTADPMKSEQDLESYDNEIKQLQVQMYQISQQTFNGVSLFANHTNGNVQHNSTWNTSSELAFEDTDLVGDLYGNGDLRNHHSISIHVSAEGASGAKINIHKSALLAAITIESDDLNREDNGIALYGFRNNGDPAVAFGHIWSFASENINDAWGESDDTEWRGNAPAGLGDAGISLGVYTQAMENVAFLRAENASQESRLNFAADSLANYQSNMRAAVGRIEDVDIAQESSQLAKQQILTRAAASMVTQANSSYELVLTMLG